PLRDDPVAHIDQTCVGCGNCGEVAEAAALCPSFYRADIVHNPTGFERWRAGIASRLIGHLQGRRERKSLSFGRAE
ncbi:MAG: indolepyruvate ferredoxin oxidoreductase, partial [Boseongicola sp.]|nr:indolepyruvate ferredoxin oxidoreductase [Boseongicola sp.]